LVRVAAAEALDILTIGRRECFTETLKHGDDLIKQLKAQGYKPGSDNCRVLLAAGCGGCGAISPEAPAAPQPEPIPAPKAPTTNVKPAGDEQAPLPMPGTQLER